jgi:riboflavin biosynthesis pyrimidine reductase
VAACIDAGLVDELRLIIYPAIAGGGVALWATAKRRRELELRAVERLSGGRLSLVYGVG